MRPKLTSLGTILHQPLRDLMYPKNKTGYDWTTEYLADGKSHHVMMTRSSGLTDRYIDGKKVKWNTN